LLDCGELLPIAVASLLWPLASPFIASKERAQVTFTVKEVKNERQRTKGGLGRGRLPPYPVGTVSL
jgi:hypothetical protein